MLIDTHAHLWFPEYSDDLEQVIERARAAGVEKMIVPGTDIESSKQAIELAKRYPGVIYASVGVHPEEVVDTRFKIKDLGMLVDGDKKQIVAIGEIGTDAHSEELKAKSKEQKELFGSQCMVALEHELPIIVHTRESFKETWEVLSSLPSMPRGQFHCFSLDSEALEMVLDANYYVSFCGNITWSKRVARLVALVPDNRLLLETDSPFMMPRNNGRVAPSSSTREQPSRPESSEPGKPENSRNEPVNVRYLAQIIAQMRGQKLEQIEEMTTENAKRLYRL